MNRLIFAALIAAAFSAATPIRAMMRWRPWRAVPPSATATSAWAATTPPSPAPGEPGVAHPAGAPAAPVMAGNAVPAPAPRPRSLGLHVQPVRAGRPQAPDPDQPRRNSAARAWPMAARPIPSRWTATPSTRSAHGWWPPVRFRIHHRHPGQWPGVAADRRCRGGGQPEPPGLPLCRHHFAGQFRRQLCHAPVGPGGPVAVRRIR